MPAPVNEDEDEALKRAVAMSLEEQSRIVEEEESEDSRRCWPGSWPCPWWKSEGLM